MKKVNRNQFIICLIIAVFGFAIMAMSSKATAIVETDPNASVLTCMDLDGQKQIYRGHRDAFNISYSSGFVRVTTSTHNIFYPSHMCIYTGPK